MAVQRIIGTVMDFSSGTVRFRAFTVSTGDRDSMA